MSVKKNFFYSSILTVANYLFPLLTYPYVSRVLGVSNIGICNFVDSIIQYFILFSTLGIVSVGIREIAGCRNNQGKFERAFRTKCRKNHPRLHSLPLSQKYLMRHCRKGYFYRPRRIFCEIHSPRYNKFRQSCRKEII